MAPITRPYRRLKLKHRLRWVTAWHFNSPTLPFYLLQCAPPPDRHHHLWYRLSVQNRIDKGSGPGKYTFLDNAQCTICCCCCRQRPGDYSLLQTPANSLTTHCTQHICRFMSHFQPSPPLLPLMGPPMRDRAGQS